MAQQVFSLFLFSLFDACVILQNLAAYISGMGTQRALWLEKLRAVVPEYVTSLWTCRCLFSVAGVATPNLVQLHQPNFKQLFFWREQGEEGGKWKLETDYSAWASFSLKNWSANGSWLSAIDCSAESRVFAGPLFLHVDTASAGLCPGVFAWSDPKWFSAV